MDFDDWRFSPYANILQIGECQREQAGLAGQHRRLPGRQLQPFHRLVRFWLLPRRHHDFRDVRRVGRHRIGAILFRIRQRDGRLVTQMFDIDAFLDARLMMRSVNCAGQDSTFGQRMSLSPSLAGASCVPQLGQCEGITNRRSWSSRPSLRSNTGPTSSGITSPALRTTTVSPISTPLRSTSNGLCKVVLDTVEPATYTGFRMLPVSRGRYAPLAR